MGKDEIKLLMRIIFEIEKLHILILFHFCAYVFQTIRSPETNMQY